MYNENIILVAVKIAQTLPTPPNTNCENSSFISNQSHHISVEFLSLPLNTHPVQSKDFMDLSDPVGGGCFDCFSAKNHENAR